MAPWVAAEYAWAAWYASWVIAAAFADRAVKRSAAGTLFPFAIELSGFWALLSFGVGPWQRLLWQFHEAACWALFAVAIAGFVFAWWARLTLGRLWSGSVTRKADHRIVDTGPYGLVRHPIYTGLLLSVFATLAIKGTERALIGAALLLGGWFIKAKIEEGFLSRELGTEAYAAYRARVPMLIPFAPK